MGKHIHHIIPRHAGGTDDPENLIELTVEEHAEAHRKLWEEHNRWQDFMAWKALSGQIEIDDLRREICRLANLGRKHSPETIKKIKEEMRKFTEEQRENYTKILLRDLEKTLRNLPR
jgi:hypothetical protein